MFFTVPFPTLDINLIFFMSAVSIGDTRFYNIKHVLGGIH